MNYQRWWVLIIILILAAVLLRNSMVSNTQPVGTVVTTTQNMKLQSDIFSENGTIPVAYTCNGAGLQPPLKILGVPSGTKSLALIVDDPNAPMGVFVHWVIWNIDPTTTIIQNGKAPAGSVEGFTGLNKPGWIAPCPPTGIHRYNFKLYALNQSLSIPNTSNKADLVMAMTNHIIESTKLVGLYGK
jgi:Raf kinase inhibitor-like YbhB/YbcL family protein